MMKKLKVEGDEEDVPLNPDLPLEIIAGILSRLDVKTLIRFKRVSKSFRRLISESFFVDMHHQQSMKKMKPLYHNQSGCHYLDQNNNKIDVLPFSLINEGIFLYPIRKLFPVTCDLICYKGYGGGLELCNPSTRYFRRIHTPPTGLLFSRFGYGYSAKSREHKLVHLTFKKTPVDADIRGMHCEVYTLSDHKKSGFADDWKPITCPRCVFPQFTSASGRIYWMIDLKLSNYLSFRSEDLILAFDIASESFSIIRQPAGWLSDTHSKGSLVFMVFDGRLCIANTGKMKKSSILDVWMLEEDCGWKMLHTVNLLECKNTCANWQKMSMLVVKKLHPKFICGGEIVFQWVSRDYVSCNLETKTFSSFAPFHDNHIGVFWESMCRLT